MTAGDAQHKAEHHDDGQAVADAGFQVGGVEGRALRERGHGIEGEQGRNREQGTQTFSGVFGDEWFFHSFIFFAFAADSSAESRAHPFISRRALCSVLEQNETMFSAR